MSEQQPRFGPGQLRGREIGQITRGAIELAGPRPGRQAAWPHRAALAAPVKAPYRDAAPRKVAHGLHLLLDEFAKATDHHAFGAGIADRQMPPAQYRAI